MANENGKMHSSNDDFETAGAKTFLSMHGCGSTQQLHHNNHNNNEIVKKVETEVEW